MYFVSKSVVLANADDDDDDDDKRILVSSENITVIPEIAIITSDNNPNFNAENKWERLGDLLRASSQAMLESGKEDYNTPLQLSMKKATVLSSKRDKSKEIQLSHNILELFASIPHLEILSDDVDTWKQVDAQMRQISKQFLTHGCRTFETMVATADFATKYIDLPLCNTMARMVSQAKLLQVTFPALFSFVLKADSPQVQKEIYKSLCKKYDSTIGASKENKTEFLKDAQILFDVWAKESNIVTDEKLENNSAFINVLSCTFDLYLPRDVSATSMSIKTKDIAALADFFNIGSDPEQTKELGSLVDFLNLDSAKNTIQESETDGSTSNA